MSSKNKKPQTLDLSALLKGLNQAGVEFIVVGGMAAVVQGAPITTFDLDKDTKFMSLTSKLLWP